MMALACKLLLDLPRTISAQGVFFQNCQNSSTFVNLTKAASPCCLYSLVLDYTLDAPQATSNISRFKGLDVDITGRICIESDDDGPTFKVSIDENCSASGLTKRMYRLTLDGVEYAAKRFYNVGAEDGTVSIEDNYIRVCEELTRQALASDLAKKFDEDVHEKEISTCDLEIAPAFILTVTTGRDEGLAWIVDPLLGNTKTEKFSGTTEAGKHGVDDLFGQTCDAFAHYSLHESGGELVFVDIQGIKVPTTHHGVQGPEKLVLFDFMTHTPNGTTGLGDAGLEGIKDFRAQHCCNHICKGLELPPLPVPASKEGPLDRLTTPTGQPGNNDFQYVVKRKTGGFQSGLPTIFESDRATGEFMELESAKLAVFGPFHAHQMSLRIGNRSSSLAAHILLDPYISPSRLRTSRDVFNHRQMLHYISTSDKAHDFKHDAFAAGVDIADFSVVDLFMVEMMSDDGLGEDAKNWLCMDPLPLEEFQTCSGVKVPAKDDSLLDRTLHAFCHYTCHDSNQDFVVVNLCYVVPSTESIPTIVWFRAHTSDNANLYGNDGLPAIQHFLAEHECNEICQAMGLSR